MEDALGLQSVDVELGNGKKLCDLDHADDIV